MARKRSDGNGYVKKLPSGNWRGQIMDGYRDDGKRNVVSFTCKTKAEVLDKIRDYWYAKDNPQPEEEDKDNENSGENAGEAKYILNTNNKKVHVPTCSSAKQMLDGNKKEYNGEIDDILAQGYVKCGICRAGT